jgi:hypothetical protein
MMRQHMTSILDAVQLSDFIDEACHSDRGSIGE